MPSTDYAAELATWHAAQQAALGAAVESVVLEVFPALNLTSWAAVDATWPAVDRAIAAAVNEVFGLSAGLAINYYELARAAEGVTGTFERVTELLDPGQVSTSLRATGPYVAKGLIASKDPALQAKLLTSLMGSSSRLALSGGRRSLAGTGKADPTRLGWSRVCNSKNPCAFCRMLRSRGPVYESEATATVAKDGERYHDHCKCTAVPEWSKDTEWVDGAQADRDLWNEVTDGYHGNDALNAFRRAVAAGR